MVPHDSKRDLPLVVTALVANWFLLAQDRVFPAAAMSRTFKTVASSEFLTNAKFLWMVEQSVAKSRCLTAMMALLRWMIYAENSQNGISLGTLVST